MRRSTVKLNKPIHHGVTVLDRAKVPMYAWHYEYMLPKYGNRAEPDYTDTDSFIYEIKTKDVYEDIRDFPRCSTRLRTPKTILQGYRE